MGRKSSTRKPGGGTVRIIAGQWRGRKLPVVDVPGLRPSGDRVRETLFNWLAPMLPGAVCADLFAGSGALGFEAASRGARNVVLIEQDRAAAQNLRQCVDMLGAAQVSVIQADAVAWLKSQSTDSYDILFADPPFGSGLNAGIAETVADAGCLKPGGLLYVESSGSGPAPIVPSRWSAWKQKRIGDVRMTLLKRP